MSCRAGHVRPGRGPVQVEREVGNVGGAFQDAQAVDQQLAFGQSFTDGGTRFKRGLLRGACSSSNTPALLRMERTFCGRRIAASRVRRRTHAARSSARYCACCT
ncbi:hypothetical protein GCM10017557_10350 [Streptomyces aurantiacus]|uniref:Uncharacterized protein n=1 Tax=Streptomyces aurantiacus TaxID=47760 RepID=A0A7G1NXB1_9ACTN|nr:hypothetical protein GCM10017557_10350 [Streptomyces aurantiacus]